MADQEKHLQICLCAWLVMGATSELDDEYRYYYPDYKTACYTLVQTLHEVPADDWIDFDELLEDELLETMQSRDPGFFPERQQVSSSRSYYERGYYGSPRMSASSFVEPKRCLCGVRQWDCYILWDLLI